MALRMGMNKRPIVGVLALAALLLAFAGCRVDEQPAPGPVHPVWKVQPPSLTFPGVVGESAPEPQSFTLTNEGAEGEYRLQADETWLKASPASGRLEQGGKVKIAVTVKPCEESGNTSTWLRVTGGGASAKVEVTRACSPGDDNANHNPSASLTARPREGRAPLAVEFTVSTSDPDNDPLTCTLDFGDNQQEEICSGHTTHRYASAGEYNAVLAVSDGHGGRASASARISVSGGSGGGETVTVFAAGDIATDNNHDAETARLIQNRAPASGEWCVFALGDLAYPNGTYREFVNYYEPTWGAFKNRTYPVPGNHEYHTRNAAGYFRYWGARAHGPNGWYKVTIGDWSVYAINSELSIGSGSSQYQWLKGELSRDNAQCSLIIDHRPRYSYGPHGNKDWMDDVWDLFYQHGGELFLSGHDHTYQRFYPLNDRGTQDDSHGVVQFVVGTGGADLYDLPADNTLAKGVDDKYGVLELELYPDRYAWRFVDVDGNVLDQGRGDCHGAP